MHLQPPTAFRYDNRREMQARAQLPPPARPGDRVGVAALSGVVDGARLGRGVERLRQLGFEPVLASNLASRQGLFAGSDEERLSAFHELAADTDLRAIFFARGGHGILRLLDGIDWQLLGSTPRAYVGYSDLTPFLDQLASRLGLVGFHGPMVAEELAREADVDEDSMLLRALAGELPLELAVERVAGGSVAEGPLVGGCLSLLTATLGTRHAPELNGAILFWEDVHEPTYRLDRMLTQLKLAAGLSEIHGMVVGRLATMSMAAGLRLMGARPGGAPRHFWVAL